MRLILFCIFYLFSFSSFSQHDKFFSDIAAAKNTDEKIRRFVSYLNDVEIDHKNLEDLNAFFIRLEQSQPSIKNYIGFHKQLLHIQQNTDTQTRIKLYYDLAT